MTKKRYILFNGSYLDVQVFHHTPEGPKQQVKTGFAIFHSGFLI